MLNVSEAATQVTREDVERCYELVLGRGPDNATVVDDFVGCEMSFMLGVFFEGPEFARRVRGAIAQGRAPQGGLFDEAPEPQLLGWLGRRLGVVALNEQAIQTWPSLFFTLFSDSTFLTSSRLAGRVFQPDEWRRLGQMAAEPARYARRAVLESVSGLKVEGWAVNPLAPDEPLIVELWIDGTFAAATRTSKFRRHLQDRFGGTGEFGFDFELPADRLKKGRILRLELREPGAPAALAEIEAQPSAPATDSYDHIRRELAGLKSAVARIEAAMPLIDDRSGFALEDYADYFDTYYRDRPGLAGSVDGPAVVVVTDGTGARAADLEQALESLAVQTDPAWRLTIHGVTGDAEAQIQDIRNRVRWRTGEERLAAVQVLSESPANLGTMVAGVDDGEIVLLLRPDERAAARLIQSVRETFQDPEVDAVYFDEDALTPEEANGPARDHCEPRLKPEFDPDLLAQTPYVGTCIAFRASALRAPGLETAVGPWAGAEAMLRAHLHNRKARIRHLARVLTTRAAEIPLDGWAECVERAFAGQAVEVLPHADVLGAKVAGAVRVRRSAEGVRATVIVPTRNALDLLAPCIDSLLTARTANVATMDLCVIDHESDDPATRDYLARAEAAGDVRIQSFAGRFNWALMNNLAADASDADVLVFLNNDTVVLTPDWLDALCSEAMRPGVGAVGARLLYGDGTIQHAGFVARGRPGNFLVHEGVGQPGSDPGYMGRHALTRKAVAVTGACLAVRRETFQRLGGFDSAQLPVDANDVDYCLRAQAEGLRVLYCPYATLYHLESKSRGFSRHGEKRMAAEAADALMWARWGERFGDHPAYNPHFDREARPFTRLRPPR